MLKDGVHSSNVNADPLHAASRSLLVESVRSLAGSLQMRPDSHLLACTAGGRERNSIVHCRDRLSFVTVRSRC